MNLTLGNSYKIIVSIEGTLLTYKCKVISIDDNFVTFIDKFNKTYSYNLHNVIAIEEIKEVNENG